MPPGNHLEILHGDRRGQHSIRINDRYRICFVWSGKGPKRLEIVDYHWKGVPMKMPTNRPPIHPGEILLEEFMKPYGMTQTEIARRIGVSRKHISEVVNGRKGISTDMALRLSRLFGTSPELWLNGQLAWDVWHAMRGENAFRLEAIEPVSTSVWKCLRSDRDKYRIWRYGYMIVVE